MLASVLKHRPLGIMSARTAFRVFGYKVIVKGRPIRDDYVVGDRNEDDVPMDEDDEYQEYVNPYLVKSRKEEEEEEEEDDDRPLGDYSGVVNHFVGFGEGDPKFKANHEMLSGKSADTEKQTDSRVDLMARAAASTAVFNSKLRAQRKPNLKDAHTNLELTPIISQPTDIVVLKYESNAPNTIPAKELKKMPIEIITEKLDHHDIESEDWIKIDAEANENSKYPIAMLEGQYQGIYSM
jgi:hypothetical protein